MRVEDPRKFLNLESLKRHLLDFGEDLEDSHESASTLPLTSKIIQLIRQSKITQYVALGQNAT